MLQSSFVPAAIVALPVTGRSAAQLTRRSDIGLESKPLQIVQNRLLILGAASSPVVVLQPQKNLSPQRPRDPPYMNRVGYMTQVQVARRTGRKAGAGPERQAVQASSTRLRIPAQLSSLG